MWGQEAEDCWILGTRDCKEEWAGAAVEEGQKLAGHGTDFLQYGR